jgi:polyhydroxyalkanoate synthesis regulator protein
MKMFSPFAFAKPDEPAPAAAPPPKAEAAPAADDALDQLRKQMEAMQAQIEKLAGKR